MHEKGDTPGCFDWRLTSREYCLFRYVLPAFYEHLQDLGDKLCNVVEVTNKKIKEGYVGTDACIVSLWKNYFDDLFVPDHDNICVILLSKALEAVSYLGIAAEIEDILLNRPVNNDVATLLADFYKTQVQKV